jgi:hypothetical protein
MEVNTKKTGFTGRSREWNCKDLLWLFVCRERGNVRWWRQENILVHDAFSCNYLTVLCASFSLAGMASSVGSLWLH